MCVCVCVCVCEEKGGGSVRAHVSGVEVVGGEHIAPKPHKVAQMGAQHALTPHRPLYTHAGKSRGYGFVEFEDKKDMKEAYKMADGRKVEGRRVLVDVERGRTVDTWCVLLARKRTPACSCMCAVHQHIPVAAYSTGVCMVRYFVREGRRALADVERGRTVSIWSVASLRSESAVV